MLYRIMAKWDSDGLLIQTRSVEKVIAPLVSQVSILVNNGIKDGYLYETTNALSNSILPNLELAICNFTSIGHEIGNTHADIHDDMVEGCDTTNRACQAIVSILTMSPEKTNFDYDMLIDASRLLLSAITRILILADKTAVNKMVASLDKVDSRLKEIEEVINFKDFVDAFSQFGSDMVELAYISGERQNDLKDDIQRAEVCASRATLEKSTMMLLTTCKTCLRHPDSKLAVGNRNAVFENMRKAMKILRAIVQDNEYPDPNISRAISLDIKEIEESIYAIINGDEQLNEVFLERLDNVTIDLEDVINIQKIDNNKKLQIKSSITLAKRIHKEFRKNILEDEQNIKGDTIAVLKKLETVMKQLVELLVESSMEQVEDVTNSSISKDTIKQLKPIALSGDKSQLEELAHKLESEKQELLEISKLVKNISTSEPCIITASRIEENLSVLLPQLIDAATMLSNHQLSKITQENLEIFMDVWDTQVDELTALLKNIVNAESNQK